MPKGMTKNQWTDLKEVLLHVPIRARNLAWKEAMEHVEQILVGRNNLSPDIDLKGLRFAVECKLCHDAIGVDEDYVRHALTGTYSHYDCHHRSTGSIGDKA